MTNHYYLVLICYSFVIFIHYDIPRENATYVYVCVVPYNIIMCLNHLRAVDLLCLDATTAYRLGGRLPAPSECELYSVDRDALFSYHKLSEAFLHRMMSLYVSSHYKNTPNDLQLMSDAPAHRLFALLGPQRAAPPPSSSAASGAADDGEEAIAQQLPDVLCVIQVCLEGRISRDSMRASMARGGRASGDLIPWTLSQQFQVREW